MGNIFDNEIKIIEFMSGTIKKEICILTKDDEKSRDECYENILKKIIDEDYFKENWINSTKSDLPPDFYNDSDNMMMEVMRFDDHSKNGKSNPMLEKENQIMIMLKEKFPNADIFINAPIELPTDKDHSYTMYFKGFERTVKKHIGKIENYRNNHPGYKLIFFVFDESSGIYFENEGNDVGRLHFHFLDNKFINVFKGEDIDYLIWASPYKYNFDMNGNIDYSMPKMVIYDMKNFLNNNKIQLLYYDDSKMKSSEY